ncbi:MAG TPA: neutral/alkaline non-lysosomal ceramidase N-terminal domain-containing protein [Verrucomicrobiales bacterium]|nr:neutral/alkaline non-lysosomal ceramidase N-terminal domain-containing protein [Verrucomicrobiales bacterium]
MPSNQNSAPPVFTVARRSIRLPVILIPLLALAGVLAALQNKDDPSIMAGAAKVDITPDYPIRLSGYGGRTTVSDGVSQRLWAKALAFGKTPEDTAVIVTVDNTGVPGTVTEEVFKKVSTKVPLRRENFTVCSSHTHNGPMLTGVLPFLFSKDIEPVQQETITRYTAELTDKLVQVTLNALQDRKPATLAHGEGRAFFARNRRTANGPVDQSLPVLVVHGAAGELRAVLANYACHCTTLASNQVGGDWAGYAQEYIEKDHPGCIALISVGCAGDANPANMGSEPAAVANGKEIATEVTRLLGTPMKPLKQGPAGTLRRFDLPFDTLPERPQWEALSKNSGITGYHARKNLERLGRGETLPAKLPYSLQSWIFGDDLAMVFMPGEVVVDYSLRLKREYMNLWVTAYANDVPCYIPSSRILKEGGYEGGGAMLYYDRPARLGPDTEELIFGEAQKILPTSFKARKMAGVEPPVSAADSLKRIKVKPGFTVELAAAEPEIVDPVAIDFGADGKLWVVEMRDYPLGMDGNGKPGGRVKFLQDMDGDGRYEKATVFTDGLPYPTGIMAWRKGALIAAAPDILYAQDTDGDGHADKVEKLFTGFLTENYQARVNGLSRGLDGWIYGANGLLGGNIRSTLTGKTVDIRGRDFRFNPDTGAFESTTGLTQQGRVRDDWDRWFGSDNGDFAWHYPMQERYLRRNPAVTPPEQRIRLERSSRVYPASVTLERFNDPHTANSATSACGGDIYRDNLLGDSYYGNYFANEPVHDLTTRLILEPNGITFNGIRAADETASEFFASTDNWCRPVQARTGPDGALWIVDMYRYVVEHPRWIPAEKLALLDVRAGDDKGRIYRVYPSGKKLRPVRDLTKLSAGDLVAALDTPNGPVRDLIQEQLVQRSERGVADALADLAVKSTWPAVRLQALTTLEGLGELQPQWLKRALTDSHSGVRANAVRIGEPFFNSNAELGEAAASLTNDPDPGVRFQLALSLGEWSHPAAGKALGRLACSLPDKKFDAAWMRTAILSSASGQAGEILDAVLASPRDTPGRGELTGGLISAAIASGNKPAAGRVLTALVASNARGNETWRFTAWANLIDALDRRKMKLDDLLANGAANDAELPAKLESVFAQAGALAFANGTAPEMRLAALRLYGFRPVLTIEDLKRLLAILESSGQAELRNAALQSLRRSTSPELAPLVIANWASRSPAARAIMVDLLLSRDSMAAALLDALEKGTVSGAEIAVPNRDRLLKNAEPSIRTRAEKVFAALQPKRRSEVLAAYRETGKLTGNSTAGGDVFTVNCSICHFMRGTGNAVGPDLSPFRNKAVPEFLDAILDPNAVIEPRYLTYIVELKDGRFAAGIINNETANSLTLSQPAGLKQTILRSEIKEIKPSPVSLMPEGLEATIKPQQMADLIAWLKGGAPRPFGSSTAESAAAARAAFGPAQANGLTKVFAASLLFNYTSWLGTLPFAHCHLSDGKSRVTWQTAAVPADLAPDGKQTFKFPGGLGNVPQPAGEFTLKLNGKKVLKFGVEVSDHTWSDAEGTVKMNYEVKETQPADSNGIFTIEVSNTLLQPGKPVQFEVTGSASGSVRWFGVYAMSPDMLPSEAEESKLPLGRRLIDPGTPDAKRMAIIKQYPQKSAEFLKEMTSDLTPGTPEEYKRIPWIWNVAIAAGKRIDATEIRGLLDISLPQPGKPLHDWQAVVIGGGIINGITLAGKWPGEQMDVMLADDEPLRTRWQRSVELALTMSADEKVPHGTRYDALRMIPFLGWEKSKAQFTATLEKGVNAELQQGAVSGLADLNHPEAAGLLIKAFPVLNTGNKNFALDALLRSPERIDVLLDAAAAGKITRADLGEKRIATLTSLEDAARRDKARKLLTTP